MGTIIGLSGKSGSGKDAFAKYVCERGYERVALADPLKRAVQASHGFTDEQLWGELKNVVDRFWGVTPREVLQKVGQAYRQTLGEDVWIRALMKRVDPAKNYVVTDVRYHNEAWDLAVHGAKLVRIERPNNPQALTGDAALHPSETELDDFKVWDRMIVNCADLPHLWAMAVSVADEFRATPFVAREPAHIPARKPQLRCPRCPFKFRYEIQNCPNCGARGEP